MPIHKKFILPENIRKDCEREVRRRNIPKWKFNRYMILLLLDKDRTYKQIQERLMLVSNTIGKWKKRYIQYGLEGLKDNPRSGRQKKITPEIEAKVCRIVQETPPKGTTHWSASAISKKTGIPKTTVLDILSRNHLKPHLHRNFMVSNDPNFEEKAGKIIGLYMKPPKNAVVLCFDEKSQIQALDRLQPNLPLKPHKTERSTFEYKRNGITNLFAAFNIQTGKVSGSCSSTHNQYDFISFLNKLDREYKSAKKIHVILDNFRAHNTANVREWLKNHPLWKFYFTPTYSSWLNQIEIWFSIISRQCIRRGVFHSVKELIKSIKDFIREYNKKAKPFIWTYSDTGRRIRA